MSLFHPRGKKITVLNLKTCRFSHHYIPCRTASFFQIAIQSTIGSNLRFTHPFCFASFSQKTHLFSILTALGFPYKSCNTCTRATGRRVHYGWSSCLTIEESKVTSPRQALTSAGAECVQHASRLTPQTAYSGAPGKTLNPCVPRTFGLSLRAPSPRHWPSGS